MLMRLIVIEMLDLDMSFGRGCRMLEKRIL